MTDKTTANGRPYRTVLITGASAGIGAGLAKIAADEAEHLVLVARREELLEQVAAEIGGRCAVTLVVADVSDYEPFQERLGEALETVPPCDLAILNAGIGRPRDLKKPDLPEAQLIFSVNFFGAIATLDAVLPGMLARGRGHIVGISSMASYRGLPGAPAYCASKSALWRYLEAVRGEVAATPVKVTTIHPGFVRTEMIARAKRPFAVVPLDRACRKMWRSIRRGDIHYSFPWQLGIIFRLIRLMPDRMFFWVVRYFRKRGAARKRRVTDAGSNGSV